MIKNLNEIDSWEFFLVNLDKKNNQAIARLPFL